MNNNTYLLIQASLCRSSILAYNAAALSRSLALIAYNYASLCPALAATSSLRCVRTLAAAAALRACLAASCYARAASRCARRSEASSNSYCAKQSTGLRCRIEAVIKAVKYS